MQKIIFTTLFVLLVSLAGLAQNNTGNQNQTAAANAGNSLSSQMLEDYGKEMDKMIVNWSKRIQEAIQKYDLMNTKDIRILPHQSNYDIGDGYIEIEQHYFIKDDAKRRNTFGYKDIQGIRLKRIRIYVNGETLAKIEVDVQEKFFKDRPKNHVIVVDPSPTTDGTDDITFTHIYEGKTIIDNKTLAEIKNNTDNPLRNNIKRDFLVPNLSVCYNSLMFIGEAYYGSLKDSEMFMENFLRDSVERY